MATGHTIVLSGDRPVKEFIGRAIAETYRMGKRIMDATDQKEDAGPLAVELARELAGFGMFGFFPLPVLEGYCRLLIRRVFEADSE